MTTERRELPLARACELTGVARIVGIGGDCLVLRNGNIQRISPTPSGTASPNQCLVPVGSVAVLGDNRATAQSGGFAVGHGQSREQAPPPNPRPAPLSSVVIVGVRDVKAKVLGVCAPPWHIRAVR